MRFRVSINAPRELGDLAPSLINDLRMYIKGWNSSQEDFKNGFIMGSDKYYYFVKVDSSMLVVTNNPRWAVETVRTVVHAVKSSKLPVEIGVSFKEERGVINVEIVLKPRQEGKN